MAVVSLIFGRHHIFIQRGQTVFNSENDSFHHLTGVFRVHMRRVEAKVDEKGDGHSILEPLHHVGLAVQGVGHVASQDDVLSCTCRHKLGLLSHSVGTWENNKAGSATQLQGHVKPAHSSCKLQCKEKTTAFTFLNLHIFSGHICVCTVS